MAGQRHQVIRCTVQAQRVLINAKQMDKLARKGEQVCLLLVRAASTATSRRQALKAIGMIEGKKREISHQTGPKTKFDTVAELREKVLDKLDPEA